MEVVTEEFFPLSRKKTIKGNRRLAREKVLQILIANEICELPVEKLFEHIFFRDFNFEESKEIVNDHKILTPSEVLEIEADIPVVWKENDIKFAKNLIMLTMEYKNLNTELLIKFADNWEVQRMAVIDKYLMLIAITEILYCPDIPTKVSINEVLDIAKSYSTDKSSVFINGILDKILISLKKEGKIKKEGRGLKESK